MFEATRRVVQIDSTLKNCPFNVGSSLDGIIADLKDECSGRAHDLCATIFASRVGSNSPSVAVGKTGRARSFLSFVSQSGPGAAGVL